MFCCASIPNNTCFISELVSIGLILHIEFFVLLHFEQYPFYKYNHLHKKISILLGVIVLSSSVLSEEIVTSSSSGLIVYNVLPSKIRVIPKMLSLYFSPS